MPHEVTKRTWHGNSEPLRSEPALTGGLHTLNEEFGECDWELHFLMRTDARRFYSPTSLLQT